MQALILKQHNVSPLWFKWTSQRMHTLVFLLLLFKFWADSHEPPLSYLHNIPIDACALETRNYVRVVKFLILRLTTAHVWIHLAAWQSIRFSVFSLSLWSHVIARSVFVLTQLVQLTLLKWRLCSDKACSPAAFLMRALPNKA